MCACARLDLDTCSRALLLEAILWEVRWQSGQDMGADSGAVVLEGSLSSKLRIRRHQCELGDALPSCANATSKVFVRCMLIS